MKVHKIRAENFHEIFKIFTGHIKKLSKSFLKIQHFKQANESVGNIFAN